MSEQKEQEVKIRFTLTPVSTLRYLSYAAAIVGLLFTIFATAAVEDGGDTTAMVFFSGLLYTVFFSGVLYGFSCLVSFLSSKK